MLITRRSPLTGEDTTLDLPVTDDQLRRHASGELIQDVFPDLTPAQREFIKMGYTPEDWQQMFPAPTVAMMSSGLVSEIKSLLWGIIDDCPGSPDCPNMPCYASEARELLRAMGEEVPEPGDEEDDGDDDEDDDDEDRPGNRFDE